MKKVNILSEMLVVALALLAIAMAFVSCENDTTGGGGRTDPTLHGTWVNERGQLTFRNDGTWESFGSSSSNGTGTPDARGTYSTSAYTITLTLTHLYFGQEIAYDYATTVGWKNRSQLIEFWRRDSMSEREINSLLSPITSTYYISDTPPELTDSGTRIISLTFYGDLSGTFYKR